MNSLKKSFNAADEGMRCAPPYALRIHAQSARQQVGHGITDLRDFHLELAALYDRMADAREEYWAEYKRKCLDLEE
ncbi:MAG: hypothetical protein DRQ40_04485 [Gammaproteobacteria bacterium]|nr:MAG: hypothetical protein DRQ40_04485 [Gammaproteobacteria bacterium]